MVSELNAAKIFAISASKYQDKLTDKILFQSDTILTTVVSFAIDPNNISELDRDQFFGDIKGIFRLRKKTGSFEAKTSISKTFSNKKKKNGLMDDT